MLKIEELEGAIIVKAEECSEGSFELTANHILLKLKDNRLVSVRAASGFIRGSVPFLELSEEY